MIEILNESNFDSKVRGGKGIVLVEFFATWCPHCQRMMPIIERFADDESGRVTTYQVDVDQSPHLANEYAPNGFPTFVLFEDGRIVDDRTGEQTLSTLEAMAAQPA